ncbi:MAG: 2-hydroxyacyl-CoA dehydratase family protein [Clostridioides sp.]|jgi:benzoyl-CoA reductase/2-hydroxyglutaryl-CoA dehydratase subunit BcrC/BadD/HgdB|nr:2-hydroxyacyl-CoA dehydratase family protein [Clostridioides sp.]
MNNSLPENFDTFVDGRKQGFIRAKELKDSGQKMVGMFCGFTPFEIPMAAKAATVMVCGVDEEPIQDAERILPRNLCPLIKSSFGGALNDTCPYFYFSDMIIGETTCDGKKKMYEILGKFKNMYVMHLPNWPQLGKGEPGYELWRDEIIKYKEAVESNLETTITEDDIWEAIRDKNDERRITKEFYSLAKHVPSPFTAMELNNVLTQALFIFDREEMKESIRKVTAEGRERIKRGEFPAKAETPRILITGCPTSGVTDKIFKLIDEVGGSVVALELCTAGRGNETLVDEDTSRDVYDVIAERYLKVGCPVMMYDEQRFKVLDEMIDEYQIDGVIDVVLTACNPFGIESVRVKDFVTNTKHKAFMKIETDYSKSDVEQIRTRLEAFIEMLEDKAASRALATTL